MFAVPELPTVNSPMEHEEDVKTECNPPPVPKKEPKEEEGDVHAEGERRPPMKSPIAVLFHGKAIETSKTGRCHATIDSQFTGGL